VRFLLRVAIVVLAIGAVFGAIALIVALSMSAPEYASIFAALAVSSGIALVAAVIVSRRI
jgi:hypothetical protein